METLVGHAMRVLASLYNQAQIDFRLLELAEFYYSPGWDKLSVLCDLVRSIVTTT